MEPETNHKESTNVETVVVKPDQDEESPETGAESQANAENSSTESEYRNTVLIGYILPFLFFLPLLDEKTKTVSYVRFHVNQQIMLLITLIGINFVHSVFLMMFGKLGYFMYQLLLIAYLVLVVIGVTNVLKDRMKALPYIGQFRILK